MYTDTKNLPSAGTVQVEVHCADELQATRRRRKLGKIWKPLLRLISPKATAKCSGADCGQVHPNNVNLNNTTSGSGSGKEAVCQAPAALLEHYAAIESKVHAEQERCVDSHSAHCADKTQGVISSASIVKQSTPTCIGCAYGRNCQHEQFHAQHFEPYHNSYQAHARLHGSFAEDELCDEFQAAPLHVLCADDSSHIYCNLPQEHTIDDELLNEWLLHSFRQLTTVQRQ